MDLNMVGPAMALGLSAIGSSIGCAIAGQASHAVMSRIEEGHGKFIGMSAAPSSQSIYGFILMLLIRNKMQEGTLSAQSAIGIGLFCGLAIMMSAVCQGMVAASGIQASARQPDIYGKCWAAIGIVESFALFAFVFAVLLM